MLIEVDELDLQVLLICAGAYTVEDTPREMIEHRFSENDLNTWSDGAQTMANNLENSAKYNSDNPDMLKNVIQTLMDLSNKVLEKE